MDNISFKRKLYEKRIFNKKVQGFDPNGGIKLSQLPELYSSLGFQASQLSKACELLKKAKKDGAKIFLTFTSNMVSSGLREVFASLVKHGVVDCIITSTGAIEEDFMKAEFDFFVGEFDVDDSYVKKQALNRIGNVFVPDECYAWMEKQNEEILKQIHKEKGFLQPSYYCKVLGEKANNEKSFLYQCFKKNIPVIVPGFVDGAIGDHIFFYNQDRKEKMLVDQAHDVHLFYNKILSDEKTCGLIVGGGIAKHHLIGAAILRNGLDYAVYISTGSPGDGSLSGARPTEAVSWNKLKKKENSVLVEAEATLVLPIIAASLIG